MPQWVREAPPPAHGTADPQAPEPALQVQGNDGVGDRLSPDRALQNPAVRADPEPVGGVAAALPRPGAKLTLLRSYPDGVMAILDETNGRVMFCRLQEMFETNLDWQPVKYPDRSETH